MKPVPGSLLIAPPAMTDNRFSKTVLLVTHHNQSGSFALCLNKPTKFNATSVTQELGLDYDLPFQLHWGGPVHDGSVWMIHDNNWENEHTLYVNEHWRVTSNESMFHHMADGDCPRTFRLVHGFCSWAPGQLEAELAGTGPFDKRSSWVVAEKSEPEWVFERPIDLLWAEATHLASNQAIDTWL